MGGRGAAHPLLALAVRPIRSPAIAGRREGDSVNGIKHRLERILGRFPHGIAAALALLALSGGGVTTSAVGATPNCTVEQGQTDIDEGRYVHAVRELSCVIAAHPTEVEGYRGRAEALLLLGRYSDAFADYARITAVVEPVHADAWSTIFAGYTARLSASPNDIPALTGASFARWVDFQYPKAIALLETLVQLHPDDVYANLFLGSSRVLKGVKTSLGIADLDRAIALAPTSPDVRFIVADAYTYGLPDPERALAEASLALEWGLDTPRVHAILGAAHNALGDVDTAAEHVARHLELVTTELVPTAPLTAGGSLDLGVLPGQVLEIPVPVSVGETIAIATSSKDYWDTIAVLFAPDGTPVVGSDDENAYFAAFDHVAETTGTYRLRVAFFEAVNSGRLVVTRT
jgi:tetratricopeptide (TPR) repeat protein